LLFFRLGDFYEMFDDDAIVGSRELDLALTTRDRGKPEEERTPMCGIPYHSAEQYISRLIAKGYKVAVCEQVEDPKLAKGIVQRDVIRIISPGTVIESSMLQEGVSNYLSAVAVEGKSGACAFCDVSTGEVCIASFEKDAPMHLINELSRFHPRESLLSPEAAKNRDIRETLERRLSSRVEEVPAFFDAEACHQAICVQYGKGPDAIGLGEEETVRLTTQNAKNLFGIK
jgi:DNA mismatch repair protein MutS